MPRHQSLSIDSSFDGDSALISQFGNAARAPRTGERALLWALLVDGLQTYCHALQRGKAATPEYREAERWIFHSNAVGITSFIGLCDVVAIDPRARRRRLLAFRERPRADFTELLQAEAA